MERVCHRAGGQTRGSTGPGAPRRVRGAALKETLDTERQWQATAIGNRGIGGQDRPTGRGDGPQRDIRRGFSGGLLRVSTGARTAYGAGCAICGDQAEEGELDSRSGLKELFR